MSSHGQGLGTTSAFGKAFGISLGIMTAVALVVGAGYGGYRLYRYARTPRPLKPVTVSAHAVREGFETVTVLEAKNVTNVLHYVYNCPSASDNPFLNSITGRVLSQGACVKQAPDIQKKRILVQLRIENADTNPNGIQAQSDQFYLVDKSTVGTARPSTLTPTEGEPGLVDLADFEHELDATQAKQFPNLHLRAVAPGQATTGWVYFDLDGQPSDYYLLGQLFPGSRPIVLDLKAV